MPYIDPKRRLKYEKELRSIIDENGLCENGDITYCIYFLLVNYLREHRKQDYKTRSAIWALAMDAAAEFRRHHIDPYEDKKREQNGDI